ncbi:alkene reductase [Flavivirga algicola]|uniref:Alkene reductase n=1 Tax=Flavivirga algicola TaxID=2729136 RepID=A0ABX1RWE1_9FLAO|nr:alkene reductase [Flavivirga algicola]NMH87320.1 alkene reductase [Flavivirga algicola]
MKLLNEFKLGNLTLKNRVIMAPLTRNRSTKDRIPSQLNITYYSQRASAGMIITESTAVSENGVGYIYAPGIYTEAQVAGWKTLISEVHKKESVIFNQLFHVGRISHPDFLEGKQPVAPSSITPQGQVYTYEGYKDYVEPKTLENNEISQIINDFKVAAKNAKEAGFDGIEIHAANGYLINQFIDDVSNTRTDKYGGSIENRSRFLFEIINAVSTIWSPENIGVRLSPSGVFNSVGDSNSKQTYQYIIEKLNGYNLGYLHLMNPMMPIDEYPEMVANVAEYYGKFYNGNLIVNGGFSKESGNGILENGKADMVAYGRLFIANPDLPERFSLDATLNEPDHETFYGGDERGYTDYPFLNLN